LSTNPNRRTTLGDIARAAGVHITTVSMALRNHPRLPVSTRDTIQALAKKMGYVHDPLMQALVAYRRTSMPHLSPPTIAYVTNWNTRYGWQKVTAHPEFYAGAEAKAAELGYKLDHFWLREEGMTHDRLGRILHSRGINGVILASHVREIDASLQFDWANFSSVKIDYFPHRPELHNVTNDQLQIIRLTMQKVRQAGYRRVGLVMDEGWDITVDNLWQAGYTWEQQFFAARDRIPPYLLPNKTPFPEWLKKHKPEVIISKAEFVRPFFQALKLSVPRDIAFVDIFLEDPTGRTAGVRQNHQTVGALAMEILAGQLQQNKYGIPEIPTTTRVEGTWFDGASCPLKTPRRRR
jgi:LacI family transcriptional regulator